MAFKRQNYDNFFIPFPSGGLNVRESPEGLDARFAVDLENIIPIPIGTGTVRFGTKIPEYFNVPDPQKLIECIGYWDFTDKNRKILRIACLMLWTNLVADSWTTPEKNKIKPSGIIFDVLAGEKLKISWSEEGVNYEEALFVKSINGTTATLERDIFRNIEKVSITSVSASRATICTIENNIWVQIGAWAGRGYKRPSVCKFLNKIFFCDGVNPVLVFDGTPGFLYKTPVQQRLEPNAAFTVSEDRLSLTFKPDSRVAFRSEFYKTGLKIHFSKPSADLGIGILSKDVIDGQEAGTKKIEFTGQIPLDVTKFSYEFPHIFKSLHVINNTLWGVLPDSTACAVSLEAGSSERFINQDTQNYRLVFFDGFSQGGDQIEAIEPFQDVLAIFLKRSTQIWTGFETLNTRTPTFRNVSSLPFGILSNEMVKRVQNDLIVVTNTGELLTGSSLNAAKQFSVSPLTAMEPGLKEAVSELTKQPWLFYNNFLAFDSFSNLLFIKIGKSKPVVGLFDQVINSWTKFSGDFQRTSFLTSTNNGLFGTNGLKIWQYSDSRADHEAYTDNGKPIIWRWTTPVIDFKDYEYHCKRFELNAKFPQSTEENIQEFKIKILTMYPILEEVDVEEIIQLLPSSSPISVLVEPKTAYNNPLIFRSNKFSVRLEGVAKDGKINIQNICLFGYKK